MDLLIITATATITAPQPVAAIAPVIRTRPRRRKRTESSGDVKEERQPKIRNLKFTHKQSLQEYRDKLEYNTLMRNTTTTSSSEPIVNLTLDIQVPLKLIRSFCITKLDQDFIESIFAFLTLLERRLVTNVCRKFKALNNDYTPGYISTTHTNNLWSGYIDDTDNMKMELAECVRPIFTEENRSKIIKPNRYFKPKNQGGGHYYIFRYIGKIYICSGPKTDNMNTFITSIHTIHDFMKNFQHVFSSLVWFDLDCNMNSPSILNSMVGSNSQPTYTWKSQCTSSLIRLFKLLSSDSFSSSLRMFTLWVGGLLDVMPILTMLYYLPPSIQYLHVIPYCNPIYYQPYSLEPSSVPLEYTISQILALDDIIPNPNIISLVFTCPSFDKRNTLLFINTINMVDEDDNTTNEIVQSSIKRGWFDCHIFTTLKQTPSLKALWLSHGPTYSWRDYLYDDVAQLKLPIYCLFHSLTHLTINAGINLYDVSWLPCLEYLRCGAIYPLNANNDIHLAFAVKSLEFLKLKKLEISIIQCADYEHERWWEYFKVAFANRPNSMKTLKIYTTLHTHPDIKYTKPTDQFIASWTSPSLRMKEILPVPYQKWMKGTYHSQNETSVLISTACVDIIFNKTRHQNMPFKNAQRIISTSFEHKTASEARLPECYFVIPHSVLEEHKVSNDVPSVPLPSNFAQTEQVINWEAQGHVDDVQLSDIITTYAIQPDPIVLD